MRTMFVILILLMITACNQTRGTFTAEQDLVFYKKTLLQTTPIHVLAGSYHASIKQVSKDMLALDIDIMSDDIVFKIPQNLRGTSGEYLVAAEESGQPVDMVVDIDVLSRSWRHSSEEQNCSISKQKLICWYNSCRMVTITQSGTKTVYFETEEIKKIVSVFMSDPGDQDEIARFGGQVTELKKSIVEESECMLD